MLGDRIGEFNGKTIVNRVLPEGKVEATDQGTGTILGLDATLVATGVVTPLPDGTSMADGNGLITTTDDDAVAFRINGLGWPTGKGGKVAFRGATYHSTQSQKLMRLNRVVGLWEYDGEYDTDGTFTWTFRLWEWK